MRVRMKRRQQDRIDRGIYRDTDHGHYLIRVQGANGKHGRWVDDTIALEDGTSLHEARAIRDRIRADRLSGIYRRTKYGRSAADAMTVAGLVTQIVEAKRDPKLGAKRRRTIEHWHWATRYFATQETLGAVPISEIAEILNGVVLCAANKLDGLVEHFSIGAMQADAALRVFQRVPNKAVITGGDRSDIQLAALQTSTRCLILTGALHANERILTQAEESGVPVILTAKDTSSTAELCESLHGHMSLNSDRKIARVGEVLDRNVNWEALYAALGIA